MLPDNTSGAARSPTLVVVHSGPGADVAPFELAAVDEGSDVAVGLVSPRDVVPAFVGSEWAVPVGSAPVLEGEPVLVHADDPVASRVELRGNDAGLVVALVLDGPSRVLDAETNVSEALVLEPVGSTGAASPGPWVHPFRQTSATSLGTTIRFTISLVVNAPLGVRDHKRSAPFARRAHLPCRRSNSAGHS